MTDTPEQMRQRIAELEEGLRWIASHDNFGLTDGSPVTRQCIDALVARAASLISAAPPASEPDADVVERVARAMYVARVGASQNCYEFDELNSEGQHHVYDGLMLEARAALLAMIGGPDAE